MAPRAASNAVPPAEVFIRFILPYNVEQGTLRLPDYFSRLYGGELSQTVTVASPDGVEWAIGLKKESPVRMFLEDGWPDFMAAHSIKVYYFMVFEYLGHSRFRLLQIFNRSCCLHRLLPGHSRRQPGLKSNGKRPLVDEHLGSSSSSESAGNWKKNRNGASGSKMPKTPAERKRKNSNDDGDVIVQLLENLTANGAIIEKASIRSFPLTAESKKLAKKMMTRELHHRSFLVQVPECQRFKAGQLVPSSFMKKYMPGSGPGAQTTEIGSVKLSSGRRLWTMGIYRCYGGSFYLRKGMKKFAMDNSLMEGDLVLFEMLEKKPFLLRASILRVAK